MCQTLLDKHFISPKNIGVLEHYNKKVELKNPVCGDQLELYLFVENDIVKNSSFNAYGCSTFIGFSSFMCEFLKEKTFATLNETTSSEKINSIERTVLEPHELHVYEIWDKALCELLNEQ